MLMMRRKQNRLLAEADAIEANADRKKKRSKSAKKPGRKKSKRKPAKKRSNKHGKKKATKKKR